MARKVLVIGAQRVLDTFMARAFGDAGWEVTRGGRRPETAANFRLIGFDRPQTVPDPCTEVVSGEPQSNGAGLKETTLVELTGLEPVTPTLPGAG